MRPGQLHGPSRDFPVECPAQQCSEPRPHTPEWCRPFARARGKRFFPLAFPRGGSPYPYRLYRISTLRRPARQHATCRVKKPLKLARCGFETSRPMCRKLRPQRRQGLKRLRGFRLGGRISLSLGDHLVQAPATLRCGPPPGQCGNAVVNALAGRRASRICFSVAIRVTCCYITVRDWPTWTVIVYRLMAAVWGEVWGWGGEQFDQQGQGVDRPKDAGADHRHQHTLCLGTRPTAIAAGKPCY